MQHWIPENSWQWLLPSIGYGETLLKSERLFATRCHRESEGIPQLLCAPHTARPRCAIGSFGRQNFRRRLAVVGHYTASTFLQSVLSERASILVWVPWSFWIKLPNLHSFRLFLHLVPSQCLSDIWTWRCSLLRAEHLLNTNCWVLPVKQGMDIMVTSLGQRGMLALCTLGISFVSK